MLCFFETLDMGLPSGDIVDASYDTATYRDGLTYADRVVFGLMFFFAVGVILFDIVTGIILDTFGSLREEKADQMEYHRTTSFIAGITDTDYEEIDPQLKFKQLNDEHQNVWNYVFFLAHLNAKSPADYNGAETMIARMYAAGDTSWMPAGKSWLQQSIENAKNSDDAGDEMGELKADV